MPNEVDNYWSLRLALEQGLEWYSEDHPSVALNAFRLALTEYLDLFGEAKEPADELFFTFSYHHEGEYYSGTKYMSFNFQLELMEVSSGGSEYDPAVGSDSYTDWT